MKVDNPTTVAVSAGAAAPAASVTSSAVAVLTKQPTWNTKNLASRLGADAVSAACAGALIAPVITIIDR